MALFLLLLLGNVSSLGLSDLTIGLRSDLDKLQELLEQFARSKSSTESVLQEQKTSNNAPSIAHATGVAEFNSAKAAIDKDLSHLLSSNSISSEEEEEEEDVVYSVHFADINGLSRLESSILIHEISEYCSELRV